MFIAVNEEGKRISLFEPQPAEVLKGLFWCEVCKERVVLKKGTRVRWHFSHQAHSSCAASYKTESKLHVRGKNILYHWAGRYHDVTTEEFIPGINRRADVLVKAGEKRYVLEFQCAAISERELINRTRDYQSCGIEPVWVLCTNRLQTKAKEKLCVHSFEWMALRESVNKRSRFLIYLDPFAETCSLLRASSCLLNNYEPAFHSIWNYSFNDLLQGNMFSESERFSAEKWMQLKKDWRFKPQTWRGKADATALKEYLLKKQSDLAFYPAEAGWPVFGQEYFTTPIYIWQTYILVEMLPSFSHQKRGFVIEDAELYMKRKIIDAIFRVRPFPQIDHPLKTVLLNYLFLLCRFGCLTYERSSRTFLIKSLPSPEASLMEGYDNDKRYSVCLQ